MKQSTLTEGDLYDILRSATVMVGDGCGFVVEGKSGRYVITAAGCLPVLSSEKTSNVRGFALVADRVLKAIADPGTIARPTPPDPTVLASLNAALRYPFRCLLGLRHVEPTVSAQCIFLDAITGVAVLGSPGGSENDAYRSFTNSVPPLPLCDAGKRIQRSYVHGEARVSVWTLSRTVALLPYSASYYLPSVDPMTGGSTLRLSRGPEAYHSGEPVLGSPMLLADGSAYGLLTEGGEGAARLQEHLPGWLLRDLSQRQPKT